MTGVFSTIGGVTQAMPRPRPPLLLRSPVILTAPMLTGAVLVFAVLLLTTMNTALVLPPFARTNEGHLVLIRPWVNLLLAVVMAAPLMLGRRYPLAILTVILIEAFAFAAVEGRPWPFYLATSVLVGRAAVTRGRRASAIGALAAVAVFTVELVLSRSASNDGWSDILSVVSGITFVMATAWTVGDSFRQRQDYRDSLLEWESGRAVLDERLRIARDLHDMVAHSISVIALQSGAARRVIDVEPAGAKEALGVIEDTSREALAGLRRMLGALRETEAAGPRGRDDAPGLGDLDRLVEAASASGLRTEVRWDGERHPLPPEVEVSAFRIVQEALTNAVRHARAASCVVTLAFGREDLTVTVVDDGQGPSAVPGIPGGPGVGYGLLGMRERVGLLHGDFAAGPRDGGGFRVAARLPFYAANPVEAAVEKMTDGGSR